MVDSSDATVAPGAHRFDHGPDRGVTPCARRHLGRERASSASTRPRSTPVSRQRDPLMTPIPDVLGLCSRRPRMGVTRRTSLSASRGVWQSHRGIRPASVTSDDRWSGRPESNRRRPAWEFPCAGLTNCHFLSEFIICGCDPDILISRLITPSHTIWAASWAAGAGRRVTGNARLGTPAVVKGSRLGETRHSR